MSKITGLASFTKRGQQSEPAEPALAAITPTTAVQAPAAGRERAQKSVVAMSFRLSRQDWERLHQLAIAEGVSINTLTLRGLSKLFEEKGLPGMTIG